MDADKRLAAFEKMLRQVEENYHMEKQQMEILKAQGKEKTATYRQYMGNRLTYQKMLSLYKEFGLLE